MNRPWIITWDDNSWTDADATTGDLILVAELSGTEVGFDVSPWDGPKQLSSWIVVLECRRRAKLANNPDAGVLIGQVLAEIYAAPVDALDDVLKSRLTVAPIGDPVDDVAV